MIKEYQPRYNVLLKDDKSYPWIAVTNEMYPRVFLTRQHIKDGTRYFGPYTNTGVARTVLDLIGKLYPVRTCRLPITPDYIAKGKGRLCLQYHIKKCRGCCTGAIDRQTYAGYIERISRYSAERPANCLPSSRNGCRNSPLSCVSRKPRN